MSAHANSQVSLVGYRPGFIGRITEVHAIYYHQNWGLDLSFESQVASELAEFLTRYDPGRDLFQVALSGPLFAGSAVVDGSAEPDAARLRWFIVVPNLRGRGIGSTLLEASKNFAKNAGYKELYLWTFDGLEEARRLYERAGFSMEDEQQIDKWGGMIREQKYVLRF
jgi:GNAT superfamily N-acetyltransferase